MNQPADRAPVPISQERLDGRVGIITGGGRGIGAATALELAGLGAWLVIADRSLETCANTVACVRGTGAQALPVAADIRNFEDVEQLRERCLAAFGRIDFVIANAAIADTSSMFEGDPAHWRDVIETNVLGTAYTVRAMLPTMQQRGTGHIVLIASVSGRETYVGEPIYIASKWAIVGLGHALRKEALRSGIRVTLVEPGLVDTPLARANPFAQTWFDAFEPLQPADVARAIAYALLQPPHMAVNEIVLRPLAQEV
jgi:NADP-dependent 3-hydroxy acid dehydrogenase YdfG